MRIAMIGPDLEAQGGIATLARTFIEADALEAVDLRYFSTVSEGSKVRKAAQMAVGQARFLKSFAGSWKPDLFHIHVADGASFYRKMVYFEQARASGKPVVLHNNFAHLEDLFGRDRVHEAVIRRAYSEADQVHVVSNDMADCIREWTDGQATIRVLFNPVPASQFPWAGPRGDKANPTVLFMGRVGDRKGIFDLVEAWPAVLQRVPHARLRVGGDGDLDGLRARLSALGIQESVEVMGWVSGDDRLGAYAESDVYCLPSYAEGLPVSVLEAMASGLAVVGTDVDGFPDAIVEGETGFMMKPGDRTTLADRLARLLEDTELRDRLGANGRARVEQVFDGEILAGTLKDYWSELVSA
jgi:glycosyltransferase involved in cell wall biosynthesis